MFRQKTPMKSRDIVIQDLSAEERIDLIGRLWDSLDPASAAPVGETLATELDRREAEADRDPGAGESWPSIKSELEKKRR